RHRPAQAEGQVRRRHLPLRRQGGWHMSPTLRTALGAGALALLALSARPAAGEGRESGEGEREGKMAAPNLGGVKKVMKDAVKEALPGGGKPGSGPAASASGAAADAGAALAGRLVLLRRKSLRDDDFVDNDEHNRDPFRS